MKIKLIILLCFVIAISSSLQAQKIKLNDVVNFEMPANSQKLTSVTKDEYASSKNITSIKLPDHPDKTTYALDNVIISIRVGKQKQRVVLSQLKKSLEEGNFGNKTKFLTINGNSFLIDQSNLKNQIWFFGTDSLGTTLINGLLEFTDINKANADLIIDKVLKGISYN